MNKSVLYEEEEHLEHHEQNNKHQIHSESIHINNSIQIHVVNQTIFKFIHSKTNVQTKLQMVWNLG